MPIKSQDETYNMQSQFVDIIPVEDVYMMLPQTLSTLVFTHNTISVTWFKHHKLKAINKTIINDQNKHEMNNIHELPGECEIHASIRI